MENIFVPLCITHKPKIIHHLSFIIYKSPSDTFSFVAHFF